MNKIIAKIKNIKNIEIIIAVVAVLIMLVIYFAGFFGNNKNNKKDDLAEFFNNYSNYCQKMQLEVQEFVSKIEGAGDASVVINWESSVELILAETKNSSPNSNTSSPTIINIGGNSQPIVLKEIYPKAIGVVVVCDGGNNTKVKVNIIMAVSTLLDIPSDKIIVLAKNKKK